MCIKLELNSGKYTDRNGQSHIGYGFYAHRSEDNVPLFAIHDLSGEPRSVLELIHLIEDESVSPECFQEMLENFSL